MPRWAQALAQLTTSVSAQFGEVNSQILQQQTAISNNTRAISSLDTYVQSQVGSLTAAVNQKMNAEVTSDGSAKASYTLNLGIIRNGVKYNTGFGMSIEPSGGSYKSTVVFAADQFGIYSGSDPGNYRAAFLSTTAVFIRDAFIQDGSITNAKIGSYIRSSNYVAGQVVPGGTLINPGTAKCTARFMHRAVISPSPVTVTASPLMAEA